MIPTISTWCSNINFTEIRWKICCLAHNKEKCDEAYRLNKNWSKLSFPKTSWSSVIYIRSVEELKILEAASRDIEQLYFTVLLRILNI